MSVRSSVVRAGLACFVATSCLAGMAEAQSLELGPCEGSVPESFRCGTLEVPEDWSRPEGRRIGLYVMRVPATSGAQPGVPPAFELAGGPGLAATGGAEPWPHRELVLVDQRGTGRSHPLRCEMEGQGPLDEMYPIELVRQCRDRLQADADLTRFGSANAVRDLDAVRDALGIEQIDVDGISYGAGLALRYLRTYPERVRRAVLIGLPGPDARTPLQHGTNAQRALERIFDRCAGDETCRDAFPDLRDEWARVLASLEKAPVSVTHPSPRTGEELHLTIRRDIFGEAFRGIVGSKPQDVPYLIHRMAAGDFRPFLEAIPLDRPSPFAEGLYLSIACADTRTISDAEAEAAARGTFLGDYRLREQRRACAEWPAAVGEAVETGAIPTKAAVLLFGGDADYITPPESVAAAWLPNLPSTARQIVVPGLLHYPDGLTNMECAWDLVDRFHLVEDPADLDTSCLESMKPLPFRTGDSPAP